MVKIERNKLSMTTTHSDQIPTDSRLLVMYRAWLWSNAQAWAQLDQAQAIVHCPRARPGQG
jgi:hypothetical protein